MLKVSAECGNYRPICLLSAAYKIFAMVLLRRLLAVGADSRLWASQYGFRKGRGTHDALHCVRRAVEKALAERGGALHVLALDWAKAFDAINTDALVNALRRFGVPAHFCSVVRAIYVDRKFEVSECSETSARHLQQSGVCQGCPLSPFLFLIVMTMLMGDAVAMLSPPCSEAFQKGSLFDVLYADDTILLGCRPEFVQEYARAVQEAGAKYGLSLHWGKTQAISIGGGRRLRKPDGTEFDDSSFLEYLGGVISRDGRADSEVSRKIGRVFADFKLLGALWSHAGIPLREKLQKFDSLVASRLAYGLCTQWLVTSQRRRLDGFVSRCLRRLLRIPPAFISRVSNASVHARAGIPRFSEQLLKQQLLMFGKVALAPPGSHLRMNCFVDDGLSPQIGRFVLKVGRPRQNWTSELLKEGIARFGSNTLHRLLEDRSPGAYVRWTSEVRKSFSVRPVGL